MALRDKYEVEPLPGAPVYSPGGASVFAKVGRNLKNTLVRDAQRSPWYKLGLNMQQPSMLPVDQRSDVRGPATLQSVQDTDFGAGAQEIRPTYAQPVQPELPTLAGQQPLINTEVPAQLAAQTVALRPQGPTVPAGVGGGFPGTGMIRDSTGKVSYMGTDGNISSFRPFQEGGVRSVTRQQPVGRRQPAGIRGAAGGYKVAGSAEDISRFNQPVFNTATRQVVMGTQDAPAASLSAVASRADEPLANTLGGIVVQGIRAKKDRLYANIENQDRLADLQGRGQDITSRGQDLDFTSGMAKNALDAERNQSLNAQAEAQSDLFGTQAESARRGAELFDQWQNEPDDSPRKASLRDAINVMQGNKEAAPKIHFATEEGYATDPVTGKPLPSQTTYGYMPDGKGGVRRITPQEGNSLEAAAGPPKKVPSKKLAEIKKVMGYTTEEELDAHLKKYNLTR